MAPDSAGGGRPLAAELLVDDVMSMDPVTVDATESALMAWEMMRRGGFHHLPVVAVDGTYLGMLDAETMAARWPGGGPDQIRGPVGELLGPKPYPRVRLGDPVRAAAVAMLLHHISGVAVTDGDERLAGIVTAHDLITLLAVPD